MRRNGRQLTFHWVELERQVRIEGHVEKLPEAESDEYFKSRPLASRIGAHVAAERADRQPQALMARVVAATARYGILPAVHARPAQLGRLPDRAERVEFWQVAGNARLHDWPRLRASSAAGISSGWRRSQAAGRT